MLRPVTLSAIQLPQLPATARDWSDEQCAAWKLEAAESYVAEAGQRGSDLACLGEVANTFGLNLDAASLPARCEALPGPWTTRLGALARRYHMALVCPLHVLLNGQPRNAAVLLGRDGTLLGTYLKVHCTQSERALGVVPGDSWPVFELDFGRVGIQICHDNSFPESARCLALGGAEIVCWPHVQSGWGEVAWEAVLRTRAIDNHLYLLAASFGTAPENAWRPGMLVGRSAIVEPDGGWRADAGRYPGIATATVDLGRPRLAHDFTRGGEHPFWPDVLADRRPTSYEILVRR